MDKKLVTAFAESIRDTFGQMAGIELHQEGEMYEENHDIISFGVSCVISMVGKIKGRLLLDMDSRLAIQTAENILGESFQSPRENMVLASASELTNIISGSAITVLNNDFALSLRLSPPIVFTGKDVAISIPKVKSVSFNYTSQYGKLKINLAFEGGEI